MAVNPDKDLRKVAEEQGWPVRDFRRPVRLRSKIAAQAVRPRNQVAAGLAAVAVGAVVFGWVVIRAKSEQARTGRG